MQGVMSVLQREGHLPSEVPADQLQLLPIEGCFRVSMQTPTDQEQQLGCILLPDCPASCVVAEAMLVSA